MLEHGQDEGVETEVGETAEEKAAKKLEADCVATVQEMSELLAALKRELSPQVYEQVAIALVEGYFPAFTSVALTPEDNLFQAQSSLNLLNSRFGVNNGDVHTLVALLHRWEHIRSRNTEFAKQVGGKLIELQPQVPPVEAWVPPAVVEEPVAVDVATPNALIVGLRKVMHAFFDQGRP